LEAVGALGPSPFLFRSFMYMYENVHNLMYAGRIEV
jgi:hypothetical protein